MLTLPCSVRIYVAAEAVDLRRGFDGLAAATRILIRQDPLNGHLFVFLNRRRNRIKLLVWDRTGGGGCRLCLLVRQATPALAPARSPQVHPLEHQLQIARVQLHVAVPGVRLRRQVEAGSPTH